MKENINYLKDVLGIKFVSKTREQMAPILAPSTPQVRLLFIGEDIDSTANQATQLLSKMIDAMGVDRKQVHLSNVKGSEKLIESMQPELVIALGEFAMESLLKTTTTMDENHGKLLDFKNSKLLTTYHPAYLLKNPSAKKLVWDDLKVAMKHLGLKLN